MTARGGGPTPTEWRDKKRAAGVATYLYTTGYLKRWVILKHQFTIEKGYYDPLYNTPYSELDGMRVSIIAHSSLTAQNCWTILSGAGAHGECATFDVWAEANGPELIELDEILDRFA
jgi:hypothetical protein